MNPKIGLLLLYLDLYDRVLPDIRSKLEEFSINIEEEFKKRGVAVLRSSVCRVEDEFEDAIRLIEDQKVDAIVTLHLAYSPSLESSDILSRTKIPIIVLDTTPEYDFGEDVSPEEIMYNHGIHGVQDLCSMLRRNGKDFFLEAGHWKKSDVIDRVVKKIKAAFLAKSFRSMRVGSIEGPFKGMGDFYIPPESLKEIIGIETLSVSVKDIANLMPEANSVEVEIEMETDRNKFNIDNLSSDVHVNSTRVGLAVRKWIKKEKLGAFTMNFSAIGKDSGFPTLPFLEASKAMANGIGYAGEGDIITAALVGTLLLVYPKTSFVEMFCPDWKGGRIFLSHMGEVNIDLLSGKPRIIEKELPFLDVGNPGVGVGQLKEGEAVYINISPFEGSFSLILSEVKIAEVNNIKMADTISGWLIPHMSIDEYLTRFSLSGGTHHSALVYGGNKDVIENFGRIMGWKITEI